MKSPAGSSIESSSSIDVIPVAPTTISSLFPITLAVSGYPHCIRSVSPSPLIFIVSSQLHCLCSVAWVKAGIHGVNLHHMRPLCYSCIHVNTLSTTTEAVIEKIQEIQHEKMLQDSLKNLHTNDNTTVEISESVNGSATYTGPVLKCSISGLDCVVSVKGSWPRDIHYDYQQGRPPKEIIVSRKCAEAVLQGAQVYIPGILASSAHVEEREKVVVSVGIEQPGRDSGWAIVITRGIVL